MFAPWPYRSSRTSIFPAGFTLMEIVVAMFIFSLASVLVAEIFVNLQKAQQKIRDYQAAATDARYLLDVLAREIHADVIDYASYPASTIPSGQVDANAATGRPLRLLDSSCQQLSVQLDKCGANQIGCVTLSRGAVTTAISSPGLQIDSLYFYMVPQTNPFSSSASSCGGTPGATPDVQPQVTVVLSATSLSPHPEDQVSFYLQTTVASRTYAR